MTAAQHLRLVNAFTPLILSLKKGIIIGTMLHGVGFVESKDKGPQTTTASPVGKWWDHRLSEVEMNPKSAFSLSFYGACDQCLKSNTLDS